MINGLYTNPTSQNVIAFQQDGKVFEYNNVSWSSNIATYSSSTNKNIKSCAAYNIGGTNYLLYIAQGKIHRANINNTGFTEDAYDFSSLSGLDLNTGRPNLVSKTQGTLLF